MAHILETHDLSLRELLSGHRHLNIPSYQRDYAWERQHARELLDDILLALAESEKSKGSRPYFLGSVLVCASLDSGEVPGLLDVVDGQQRLITLTIIFACLRDLLNGAAADALHERISNASSVRVRLRDRDAAAFRDMVQSRGATRKGTTRIVAETPITHANIAQNRNDIRLTLRKLPDEQRGQLALYLADCCRIVLIKADDFDYAYQIFLSINERGKELTIEDIFQAELVGPLDDSQQRRYAPIIGQVGKYRRENQRYMSRAKTFFSHIAFARGWSGQTIVRSIRDAIRGLGGAKPFADRVFVPMAEAYLLVSGLEPAPTSLAPEAAAALEHLQMLEEHGDDDWVPTAMLLWERCTPRNADLTEPLKRLDRFAHLLMALGFGGAPRKQRYRVVNEAIVAGKPWPEIFSKLAVTPKDEGIALKNIAQRLHSQDKATCRLFLLRIDSHLSRRPLAEYRALPSYKLKSDNSLTIEHILPQGGTIKAASRAEWESLYRDSKHRQVCAQYLGNLALVTDDENQELGQKGFADKKKVLLGKGAHPIQMTDALRSASDWRYDELVQRHDRLMTAAQEIWQLKDNYPRPPSPPTRKGKRGN